MAEPKQQLKDYEEQRDLGMTWFLIGIMFWLFAGLVLFFNPAALKLGQLRMVVIASVLAFIGLVLFVNGLRIRAKAR